MTAQANASEFFQPISREDIGYELLFQGFLIADASQTIRFRNQGYYELNAFLGNEPSQKEIILYNFFMGSGHAVVAKILPTHYRIFGFIINPRRLWQIFWIRTEYDVVLKNQKLNPALTISLQF